MDRGLRVQLSPNEIGTLRQIAFYGASHTDLRLADTRQLQVLRWLKCGMVPGVQRRWGCGRLALIQRKPGLCP